MNRFKKKQNYLDNRLERGVAIYHYHFNCIINIINQYELYIYSHNIHIYNYNA